MEEVWKDIGLASLNDPTPTNNTTSTTTTTTTTTNFPAMILQDFLARPFTKDPPTTLVSLAPTTAGDVTTLSTSPSPPPPPPATVLSLNSGPNFHYLHNTDPLSIRPHSQLHGHVNAASPPRFVSSINPSFDALGSSSGLPSFCKKRVPDSDDNPGDRRHKRMIKNRESAARSRARKQAYTNELELEVAHLMKENEKLRKQQQQLHSGAAAAQLPKKHTLCRTSTAPF